MLNSNISNFLVASSLGVDTNRWKKEGECRFKDNNFADCDYNLPSDVCQEIGKACRWMIGESNTINWVDIQVNGLDYRIARI